MMQYGPYVAFGAFSILGGILHLLFWILVIWLIVALFRRPGRYHWHHDEYWRGRGRTTSTSALDILKERYAKGEITKEQFDQMRKDLDV